MKVECEDGLGKVEGDTGCPGEVRRGNEVQCLRGRAHCTGTTAGQDGWVLTAQRVWPGVGTSAQVERRHTEYGSSYDLQGLFGHQS